MTDSELETYYEKHVLPQFTLPRGDIHWQGHGELDIDSSAHYFELQNVDHLLVFEAVARTGHYEIIGDAIAPHQSVEPVAPKDTSHPDVYMQRDGKYIPDVTGHFLLYEIVTPS